MAIGRFIYVPCPDCGHNNLPNRKPSEVCKLFLTDKLPACKKCGRPIKSQDLQGLSEQSVYMKRARRELKEAGIDIPPAERETEKE